MKAPPSIVDAQYFFSRNDFWSATCCPSIIPSNPLQAMPTTTFRQYSNQYCWKWPNFTFGGFHIWCPKWGRGAPKSRQKEQNQLISVCDRGRGSKKPYILRTSYMEDPFSWVPHFRLAVAISTIFLVESRVKLFLYVWKFLLTVQPGNLTSHSQRNQPISESSGF